MFNLCFISKVNPEWKMGTSTSFHLRGDCQSTTPAPCIALPPCGEPVSPFSQRPTTLPTLLHLSLTPWLTPHLCSWMLWRVAPPWPIVRPSLCRLIPGQFSSHLTVTWILEDDLNRDEDTRWQEDRGLAGCRHEHIMMPHSVCNSRESVSAGALKYFRKHAGRHLSQWLLCIKWFLFVWLQLWSQH